ncbi:MAG: hypothetical protein QOH66_1509 [Actinomycetota bacterium]|nr:hypothetical protein [Actinomycetota bacterium]
MAGGRRFLGVLSDGPYTTTTLTSDNVAVTGNLVTFPSPGDYVLAASANTTTGDVIQASPVTIHVTSPPAFTITAPAASRSRMRVQPRDTVGPRHFPPPAPRPDASGILLHDLPMLDSRWQIGNHQQVP